ncbi:hypothetical protein AVEN_98325-1 [Araneus ventricosus]|uniref:Uncharacterized protein n=1 Tax=Araneus ventricosus TaxID=182803 RepID=A0A4Y2QUS9_ARAVE|nr:hypothetical protein AVEN_98325-1 [Araneus ventricosus]
MQILRLLKKTKEKTICQAWMNQRDDCIQLEDNEDEEELEENPSSAQETLRALRTLRRSVQYRAESFYEHYSYKRFIQQMLDNSKKQVSLDNFFMKA